MSDYLLRRDLARLDAQWHDDASQMHAHDAAVRHRTLTMAAELTAVLEEAGPASPGPGVVTRRATRLALINAIRGQHVMVSLTGPPADLEVAAWLADLILAQLPEAASPLPFGATGATKDCGCGPDEPCDEHADRSEAEPGRLNSAVLKVEET